MSFCSNCQLKAASKGILKPGTCLPASLGRKFSSFQSVSSVRQSLLPSRAFFSSFPLAVRSCSPLQALPLSTSDSLMSLFAFVGPYQGNAQKGAMLGPCRGCGTCGKAEAQAAVGGVVLRAAPGGDAGGGCRIEAPIPACPPCLIPCMKDLLPSSPAPPSSNQAFQTPLARSPKPSYKL